MLTVNAVRSGGSSGGGSRSKNTGYIITSSGGKVTATEVTVTAPAGAVEEDIRVQIEKVISTSGLKLPEDSLLISRVFDIVKNRSGNFSKPVTITLSFDKTKMDPDKYTVSIYWYDEENDRWVELDDVRVDMESGTVIGKTDHFTKFAVIATPKAGEQSPAQEPEVTLTDIAGHWAEQNIKALVASGAIGGYPDGSFKPDKIITSGICIDFNKSLQTGGKARQHIY